MIKKLQDAYVNIKEVFPKEEKDFSPWIVEHLQDISDIIGYQLSNYITEKNVGRYECDIVADIAHEDDGKVIIENKLGTMDHDHIGKALTYMGYERAKCVVWICDNYYDEHIKAINYLNEITATDYSFYAIKVDFYKFQSEIRYNFTVIAKPDETVKKMLVASANAATETQKLSLNYFMKFKSRLDNDIFNNFREEPRGMGYAYTTKGFSNKYGIMMRIYSKRKTVEIWVEEGNNNDALINSIYNYLSVECPEYNLEISTGAKNKDIQRVRGIVSSPYVNSVDETLDWAVETFTKIYRKMEKFNAINKS